MHFAECKFIVDVNVLSEPTKPQAVALVSQWLLANHKEIVVDHIGMGEVMQVLMGARV